MEFGERLRSLREKKKITQKELAKIFKVAESTISMYERGEREPSFDLLDRLADFYDVSIDYLMGREEKATGGRAYYDGGKDWTPEEHAAADAFIETLRKRRAEEKKRGDR